MLPHPGRFTIKNRSLSRALGLAVCVILGGSGLFAQAQSRVVVVGEAAFLSAQIVRGPAAKAADVEELRVGMTREDTDNKQFVLNAMHWLSGLL